MKQEVNSQRFLFILALLATLLAVSACTVSQESREPAAELGQELTIRAYPPPVNPTTLRAYPAPSTPTGAPPTPLPTQTRPPEPTLPPISTLTPLPPTATPNSLPPIALDRETLIFALTSINNGGEIYRVQLDKNNQVMPNTLARVDAPILQRQRISITGLYPSPNGQDVAVVWNYGDGGSAFTSILNVNTGLLTPLLGKDTSWSQVAIFLDWSPDGENILVLAYETQQNMALSPGVWMVNVKTHNTEPVNTPGVSNPLQIRLASFSPDGKEMLYSLLDFQTDSEQLWRMSLDNVEAKSIFSSPGTKIGSMCWATNDNIVVTLWSEPKDFQWTVMGELWSISPDGTAQQLLDQALTGPYQFLSPICSPDGNQIAYLKSDNDSASLDELTNDLYIVEPFTRSINRLTTYQDSRVTSFAWSPDGKQIMLVSSQTGSQEHQLLVMDMDKAIGETVNLTNQLGVTLEGRYGTSPIIVWLSSTNSGGSQ